MGNVGRKRNVREVESRKGGEDEERKRLETDRARQARNRERAKLRTEQFRTENSEVFARISDLLSTCAAPVVEIMRAAGAIEGTDIEMNPKAVVWMDAGFILKSFGKTSNLGNAYIKRLWSKITRAIRPPDVEGVPPLSVVENRGVKQLGMILFLSQYDKQQGTSLSSKAAKTYLAIVSAVSSHCGGSVAVNWSPMPTSSY